MARFTAQIPTGTSVQQLEPLLRAAIFKPAAGVVGWLLQQAADRLDRAYQPRPGEQRKGRSRLTVDCLFGSCELWRDYFHHAGKGTGHFPADAGLGLEGGYTPALARLICLEGADETGFEKAARHLAETGGIEIEARQIQRVVQRVGEAAQEWQQREGPVGRTTAPILYVSADGTGVPMRTEELVGRRGKQADGSAKTRQVYLGCVFTQEGRDEEGHPVRELNSTTYVSSFGSIHEFGPCLRQEALRRGMATAGQVVLLVDGAAGLESMGEKCFHDAVQIVDFYHAVEHAGEVVDALIGKSHPNYKAQQSRWAKGLLKDKVGTLVAAARKQAQGTPREELVEERLGYFERNVERMKYGSFRERGFFIGSGVVEAGCRAVVGVRCKQSGMRWSKAGAERILALRCIYLSRNLNAFWKLSAGGQNRPGVGGSKPATVEVKFLAVPPAFAAGSRVEHPQRERTAVHSIPCRPRLVPTSHRP